MKKEIRINIWKTATIALVTIMLIYGGLIYGANLKQKQAVEKNEIAQANYEFGLNTGITRVITALDGCKKVGITNGTASVEAISTACLTATIEEE